VRRVSVAAVIDAPVGLVWPLISEFRHWPAWGPSIRAVEADAGEVAAGVTGRVQTIVGLWLPFEITSVEPGRAWHWKVAGIAATGHEVSPIEDSRTRVTFTVPWTLAPYRMVLRAALSRIDALAAGA
jgi:hypothetical protein